MDIDRRRFVSGACAAGALAFADPSLGALGRAPNVIFIMADDLGYADLSCMGSHHISTPNIDSLAKGGMRFVQGYANSCVCSPTRTALLTGCYQQRFRIGLEEPIAARFSPDWALPKSQSTIASLFRKLGYRTALVGKWHLGDPPSSSPLVYGYDRFFGIAPGGADYFRHKPIMGGKELGPGIFDNMKEIERTGYLTDLLGDEAARIAGEPSNKPLFLSLHFTAPHWPWEARDDRAISDNLTDFTHHEGGSLKTYAKMVEAMDDNVGKILAVLRERGQLENSIIVFTSDNGGERFSETWPFIGVKEELFEGGIRVPLLVQWPGRIAAGTTTEQVMTSMDFLPTLVTLAGGRIAHGAFDGMDLSAQLMGEKPVDRTLYWRHKSYNQAAMRDGDWKYLAIAGREHVFNLAEDVRERADKAKVDESRLAAMRQKWQDWNSRMLPYSDSNLSADAKEEFTDRY